MIGQVEEKNGRNVFIRTLNLTFNLNNVQAEFLPAEGTLIIIELVTHVFEFFKKCLYPFSGR